MKRILFCLIVCLSPLCLAAANYEVYGYAPEVERSDRFAVSVDGKEVVTIPTNDPHVAVFGADGKIEVKVKFLKGAPKKVEVRPLGKNYEYSLNGDELTVVLSTYDNVSVEADGDLDHPLFIFVNPLEASKLKAAKLDPDTLVLKPGAVYTRNFWQIFNDYDHVYIPGGTIVKGFLRQDETPEDCSIDGCGILDARARPKEVAFHIRNSKGFKASNITVLNSVLWTFRMDFSDNFVVDNVKAVGDCPFNDNNDENDAIHFVASTNGVVRHCFAYSWDDAYNITSSFFANIGKCDNITLEDCVGWNVHPGNSFEISWSTKEDVSNISFRNIYSIHSGTKESKNRRAGVSIHNGGPKTVSNVSYENVWIEDPMEHAISLFILKDGQIHDVSYKNVHILKGAPRGFGIQGRDEDHQIRNVTMDGIYVEGRKISSLDDPVFHSAPFPLKFVDNIVVK